MKSLITLLAAAGLAVATLSQTATPPSAPVPEMHKLAVWYGDWTSAGEIHTTPLGSAGKFTGSLSGRPILDGTTAEFTIRERSAAGELEAREFCWFDPVAKKFAYVFLGNDGNFEQGWFSMDGELCAWECTGVAAGTAFRSRGTEVVSPDKQTLTRKADISLDGKTWLPYFNSKFTKVVAPTTEQELVRLEHEWCAAYVAKDTATMGRIEAADWICTTWDGSLVTRDQDIADVAAGFYVATEFKVEDLKVRVHGDTAIVTGRQTEKATYKGEDASGVFRITDSWIRRDGRWQCIASQLTKIAP